jgi:hypothetical protein
MFVILDVFSMVFNQVRPNALTAIDGFFDLVGYRKISMSTTY